MLYFYITKSKLNTIPDIILNYMNCFNILQAIASIIRNGMKMIFAVI